MKRVYMHAARGDAAIEQRADYAGTLHCVLYLTPAVNSDQHIIELSSQLIVLLF